MFLQGNEDMRPKREEHPNWERSPVEAAEPAAPVDPLRGPTGAWNSRGIPQALGNRCAIPTAPTGLAPGSSFFSGFGKKQSRQASAVSIE